MPPILSHRNHFKFGFDREWFRLRTAPNDEFTVEYGRCDIDPCDFRTASIRAARLIADTADAPIHVLFSGGVDSEVTMLSFLAAGVPVTAAIMQFDDNVNEHDIAFAIAFCEAHGIPYNLYNLDVVRFLTEQVWDYTNAVRCNAPMMAATMWLVDQIDGYPVLGQGECLLLRPYAKVRVRHARVASYFGNTFAPYQWALQESESVNGWYRHFLLRNRNGVVGFHQFTPEQILSYLQDPYVIEMMATAEDVTNEKWKLPHYQRHFSLEARPKYTGYEHIMDTVRTCMDQHVRAFPHAHSFVLFDYNRLVRFLEPPMGNN